MELIRTYRVELIKAKNSFALWLTVLGAGFIPTFMLAVYFQNGEHMIPTDGISPWTDFFQISWNGMSFLYTTYYIVLLICLIQNIEHKSNGWKFIFTQPQSKSRIYWQKLILVFQFIISFYLLYTIFLFLSAGIINWMVPELQLFTSPPNIIQFLKTIFTSIVSSLAIVAIHFWLSFRIKNMIIPIAIAVVCGMLFVAFYQVSWEHIELFPYAYHFLTVRPPEFMNYESTTFLNNHELFSVLYFVVISGCSYWDFRNNFLG